MLRSYNIRRGVTLYLFALLLGVLLSSRCYGADLYASPTGSATAAGTIAAPLDLPTAVGPKSPVQPGDTLWLLPGVYHYPYHQVSAPGNIGYGFQVQLVGTAVSPITIRGVDDSSGHAVIDGGIQLDPPATHIILEDFEVTVLAPRTPAIWPDDTSTLPYEWGGVNLFTGDGCELLGLVVDNNCQGMSIWEGTTNTVVRGCLIYNNGWVTAPDGSKSGHDIYTQNRAGTGTKTYQNCYIAANGEAYSFHAYGESGHVDAITLDNCVLYKAANVLLGGNLPSHSITVSNCDFYHTTLRLGWYAPFNEDCTVVGNFDMQPSGNEVDINNYVHAVLTNNTIVGWGLNFVRSAFAPPAGDTPDITASTNVITGGGIDYMGYPDGWQVPAALNLGTSHQIYAGYIQGGGVGTAPTAPTVHVRDMGDNRALVDVLDWTKAPAASADLSSFLHTGDRYSLHSPTDVWGPAVASGVYDGKPVALPIAPGSDFGAWIVQKEQPPTVTLDTLAAQLADLTARVTALETRIASPPGPVAK